MTDPEDTNGERVRLLADHNDQLSNEIISLRADLHDLRDYTSYLTKLRQAWVEFHNAAAVIRNYYMDDDNEEKLNKFMFGALVASDKRLNELEEEITIERTAMDKIRDQIRGIKEEMR